MSHSGGRGSAAADREILLTRVIDAPQALATTALPFLNGQSNAPSWANQVKQGTIR